MKQPAPHLAIDSNILYAIADRQSAVTTMVGLANMGKILLFVPPEVLAELSYNHSLGDQTAGDAIRSIGKNRGISPLTMSSVQHAIARSVSERLLRERILPSEEKRDATSLAQAAACGLSAFVTFDQHFLDIDRRALSALLLDEQLAPIAIISPVDLIRASRRAQPEPFD